MSTSLLYHAFGLVGYDYLNQTFQEGRVIFHIEQPRERLRCQQCGDADVWAQGGVNRRFRTVPIGGKPVEIHFKVPRVLCFACGQVRQVKVPFAEPLKRYTRSFARYALDLSQHMTIQDVADHLQVSWDTIKEIQAKSLKRRFGKPKLRKLRQIAIDEIAVGKGHRYLTVVLDLLSGAVVFVGDGKGVEALEPFWKGQNVPESKRSPHDGRNQHLLLERAKREGRRGVQEVLWGRVWLDGARPTVRGDDLHHLQEGRHAGRRHAPDDRRVGRHQAALDALHCRG